MAKAITVDLATTIIPSNHKVWKLFPGEAYKFLNIINETKTAFLDVRGLEKLFDKPADWKRSTLVAAVSKDRWARQNANKIQTTERRVSPNDQQTATLVDGLLLKANKGDLVVVPNPGPDGKIDVYQITSKPGTVRRIEAQDGRSFHTYIGRRMQWQGSLRKRALDYGVSELLHTPVAFFDMGDAGRFQFYEEVFGNFVYKNEVVATYRVGKEDYNSRDNRIVSTWMEFVDLVSNDAALSAALSAAQGGTIGDLIDSVTLTEDQRSDLSININSPGEILMRAVSHTPLIGLALYPMAAQGVAYSDAKKAEVHVTSIGDADGDCKAQIDASVRTIVEALGAKRWQRACELAYRAQSDSALSTDATIE